MPNFYTYIVASLPMLSFPGKPAITSGRFLESCAQLVSEQEFSLLKAILEGKELSAAGYPLLKSALNFETALRNELLLHRAARKKQDPHKYLRPSEYWDLDVIHAAMAAYKNTSVIEAEKILDLERWRHLDELCAGHFFDFEFLLIYALKLKILERWERIIKADTHSLLEGALN